VISLRTLGFGLMGLSTLLYFGLLAVPFIPLTAEERVAAAAALVIGGEVSFWAGGLLLGREIVTQYRQILDPRNWHEFMRILRKNIDAAAQEKAATTAARTSTTKAGSRAEEKPPTGKCDDPREDLGNGAGTGG